MKKNLSRKSGELTEVGLRTSANSNSGWSDLGVHMSLDELSHLRDASLDDCLQVIQAELTRVAESFRYRHRGILSEIEANSESVAVNRNGDLK